MLLDRKTFILQITGDGSCLGDSGGPLVSFITGKGEAFYEQVAIVSGGFGSCGNNQFPGIYVRLEDYKVLRWIYRIAFGKRLSRPSRRPPSNPSQVTIKPSTQSIQSTQETTKCKINSISIQHSEHNAIKSNSFRCYKLSLY